MYWGPRHLPAKVRKADQLKKAIENKDFSLAIALLERTGRLGEIAHGSHNEPFAERVSRVGLWLAAHKYFEVDRRKGDDLSWKYEQRVYYKHFPLPRLKKLHPSVVKACERGVTSCVNHINEVARGSSSFDPSSTHADYVPFSSALEMFQFRTSATYFMCWFTMKQLVPLKDVSFEGSCLKGLNEMREQEWANIDVVDFRTNSPENPFQCSEIWFCPDPCYGRKSEGSVTMTGQANDKGNPCRHLQDPTCDWDRPHNLDMTSLMRNRFNITCNCHGEEETQPGYQSDEAQGFEWSSKFGFCVDIDECRRDSTLCDQGRQCQNVKGSYVCTCARGDRYDVTLDRCVEHVPLPAHSYSRPPRVKPKTHRTKLMRHLWYLLGLSPSTDA